MAVRGGSQGASPCLVTFVVFSLLVGTLTVLLPQAASATTVSDSFDRANGALGSNWTTVSGTAAPQIVSDSLQVGTASAVNSAYWSASTFGNDQFAQASLPASSGTAYGPGIAVRLSSTKGYFLWYGNSPNTVSLWKMSSSTSWTTLKQSGPLTISPTDVWRIQAVGSTISGYQNGNLVVQATDTSIKSGSPGVWLYYSPNQITNWSGGDVTTYSVGGTVSGLSGTVVLQDNGGDNLSDSAIGGFTFATGLTAGSAYNVTVDTNPAGQTCSVANGSGTVGSASITNVAVTCTSATGSGSDDFDRPDGPLGANWTGISDGSLTISAQAAAGTNASDISGDMRTAESYSSNQYSQVEVTSAQLTGAQWIGPAVRLQDGGQDGYAGIYNWNNGSPELMLFKRTGGNWAQLGNTYSSGPLTAGTALKLEAVGSTLAFLENGTERIAVYDPALTGGAPGILISGTAKAGDWSGGTAGFAADYLSTDANGVKSYDMISADDGYGPQILRVLPPTNPAPGVAHNFLFVLPVEPGLGTSYGDGLATAEAANAQNQYNLTVIEPSFAIDPWYANNPNDPDLQYETFMTSELEPWVKANLATTGTEQIWLLGFSKSGLGAQDLLLKHPNLFTLAASWDFPADMPNYAEFGTISTAEYGTDANYQANYRLTAAFLSAHKTPFTGSDRIWIGGYSKFETDVSDYGPLLTSEGIAHTTETPASMAHRWDSGWVPLALSALEQESQNVP